MKAKDVSQSDVSSVLSNVRGYTNSKLTMYGATARGADWNSSESQERRFEQLMRVVDFDEHFSLIDYGCAYGALVDFISAKGCKFDYCGFDISSEMIDEARKIHAGKDNVRFVASEQELEAADYTVSSGIFNYRMDLSDAEWENYINGILDSCARLSRRGFSFNMLTKYSDADRMRPDLYYADPCKVFDYCKTTHSRNVALLHDYDLFDFTVVVRL